MSDELDQKIEIAAEQYRRDGVAVIPGVFSQTEVNRIKASALLALSQLDQVSAAGYPHKALETRTVNKVTSPALIFWPSLANEHLNRVRIDSRLATIVRRFLGDEVKQLNNQIYFRLPDDGDSFAWHQDIFFRKPRDHYRGIEQSYLQSIIVLDHWTEENGAVEFIPGSHLDGEQPLLSSMDMLATRQLRKFNRKGKVGVKYTAEPGDVLIWSVMTVHGSEPNKSNASRMTYMNGFAKADAAKDWPLYLRKGKPIKNVDTSAIP